MYALPALVSVLALIQYFVFGFQVGQARGKYGVKAPATSGHELFERAYRVQMNTLEQIVIFLPALWLFVMFLDAPQWAAGLGTVWLIGRLVFSRAYRADPAKRSLGFVLTVLPSTILLLGALYGIGEALLRSSMASANQALVGL